MKPGISFVIGAALAGAFKTAIGQAEGQLGRLGAAMESLQGRADKLAAFRKASADLDQAKIAWAAARQNLARLKAEMVATENPSRALQGAFTQAQRAADAAKQAFLQKGRVAREMRTALDQAGISVRNLAQEERRLGAALDAAKAKTAAMNQVAELRQQRAQMIGDTLAAAVVPGTIIATMRQAAGVAGDFEHALMRFGNTAGFSQEKVEEVRRKILDLSATTNQTAPEMLAGLEVLVGRGMDPTQALVSMASIGRAATATGASVEDMAKTAFALQDSLKISPDGLAKAIDSLAQSGKSGGFELRDMAKHLPVLTAQAQALGMKGADAVASLGASLQLAFKGTGNADAAATNLTNFLSKVTSKEAVENFRKMGVDLQQELTDAMQSGEDPILFMIQRINDLTDGDQFKLNELFGDQQVKQFILPMLQNLEDFKKIKAEALSAEGVNDKDFERALATANERFKGLGIAMSNFGEAIGRILLPPLGWIADKIGLLVRGATWLAETFPNLTGAVMGATLAFTSYRAAMLSIGVAKKTMEMMGLQSMLLGGSIRSLGGEFSFMGQGFTSFRAGIASTNAVMKTWITTQAAAAKGAILGLPSRMGAAVQAMGGYARSLWTATQGLWGHTRAMAANTIASMGSVAGWQRMGSTLAGSFMTGIKAAIVGIRTLGLAMLTNPIGLIITGIALGAALIYKYWEPISGFFQGVWQGITQAIEPVSPAIERIGAAIAPLFAPVQWLWDLFSGLLQPVQDVDGAAQVMGQNVGAWIGSIINGFLGMFGTAFEWLGKLTDAAGKVWNWIFGGDEKQAPPKVGDAMPQAANDNTPAAAVGVAIPAKAATQQPTAGSAITAAAPGSAMSPPAGATPPRGPQGGNVVQFRPQPTAPAQAAQTAPVTITIEAPITIHAVAGMDEKAIARQVKIALQDAMREAEAKRRAANHD